MLFTKRLFDFKECCLMLRISCLLDIVLILQEKFCLGYKGSSKFKHITVNVVYKSHIHIFQRRVHVKFKI